jgi:hypothetical protein
MRSMVEGAEPDAARLAERGTKVMRVAACDVPLPLTRCTLADTCAAIVACQDPF